MALHGTLVLRDGALHVVTAWTITNEPIERRTYWKVEATRADPYGFGRPEGGERVRYDGDGYWRVTESKNGRCLGGGVYTGAGDTPAAFIEEVAVPAPKVRRGVEVRWRDGAWKKLLKKGWVPA